MQVGKYEFSERSNTQVGTAITFLLIGLGAGALAALLFAPKSGKQMRKDLRQKYDDAVDTFEEWKDEAKDAAEKAVERGAKLTEDVRNRVAPIAKSVGLG
jgi:gas vesicle protein